MTFWETVESYFDSLGTFLADVWKDTGGEGFDVSSLTSTQAATLVGAFVGLIVLCSLFWTVLRSSRARSQTIELKDETRGARLTAFAVAGLFFGVLGAWAWFAPLSSAAIAPGVVSPDGSRKTVQHLEGGIIRTIHVREGETVLSGDTLLTLEDVQALARLDELRERMIFLLATEARLLAEAAGQDNIQFSFSQDLLESSTRQIEIAQMGQRQLFDSRRQTLDAQARILAKRIEQLDEETIGLEGVISAQSEQLDLIGIELDIAQDLYEQGLQRLSPVLALQRQEAELKANRALNRASISRIGQQVGETELQLYAIRQQSQEQVNEELARVRNEIATIRSQLPEREDALFRTVVTAPISGEVLNIRVTTENGGILRPGGDILDIVPQDADLVIDARVSPQDIDTVFPGMRAQILLTAYTQRNLPRIFGTLQSISADRFVDERTGEPFFLAKVIVDASDLEAVTDDIELIVGMPADVMILTGERTVLDYLIRPFMDSLRGSFRES